MRAKLNGLLNYLRDDIAKQYPGTHPIANIMIPCAGRKELEVFACSQDMEGTAMAGSVFPLGRGLVGDLWKSGLDVAFDAFSAPGDHATYALDEQAVRLYEDITCIISLAIREGFGKRQRLLGFLNLHSTAPNAPTAWLVPKNDDPASSLVSPGLLGFLIETRDYLAACLSRLL